MFTLFSATNQSKGLALGEAGALEFHTKLLRK